MFKNLLKRLRGDTDTVPAGTTLSRPAAIAPASAADETIRAFDTFGREVQVRRQDWIDNVLLPQLKAQANDPDGLYGTIVSALNDGMAEVLDDASAQLLRIDPNRERGIVIRAIVSMKLGRLDAAESLLQEGIRTVGETGTLLTNLAKVAADRGDDAGARRQLQRALALDPNLDNALMWWLAMAREAGGDGYLRALTEIAARPEAWRAQLWLARERLAAGDVDGARALYAQVLQTGKFDGESLMMMTGDLGNAGHVPLMIELLAPVYDVTRHDPRAGMNLVQAYTHEGRLDEAQSLLDRLYTANLVPFKAQLDTLGQAIIECRRQHANTPVDPEALRVVNLALDGPIWTYGLAEPEWLYAPKPEDAPKIVIVGFDHAVAGDATAHAQMEDDVGRLARGVPLFIAEELHELSKARVTTVLPAVENGGLVLFGATGSDDAVLEAMSGLGDIVMFGTVTPVDETYRIDVRVWDLASRTRLGTAQTVVRADKAGGVLDLARQLLRYGQGPMPRPLDRAWTLPTAEQMPVYLHALSQSYLLNLVGNGVVQKDGLYGERNLLEWPLRMALQWGDALPQAVPMYLSALRHALRYGSTVLPEFAERTASLLRDTQRQNLPVQWLAPLADDLFDGRLGLSRPASAPPSGFDAWVTRMRERRQRPSETSAEQPR